MKLTNKLLISLAFLSLAACKTYEITPGSERVRVFDAEPKGCLYVGEISSVQEDRSVGTLETEMDLTTRVDLRNKAHSLGGNILVFLKGKNTNTLPGSPTPAAKISAKAVEPSTGADGQPISTAKKDTLVFLATVFKCPSSVLNQ